jgi:glyoxylase I family protein
MRLDHAAVMTSSLDEAIDFYVGVLGLQVHVIEPDPIRKGRRRALLTDDDDREVLELIEMPEMSHPVVPGRGGIHHLGFRLPRRDWQALRSRMDASARNYQEVDGRLFVRDRDGLVIEIEQG